jgi:hypothetical protein
MLALSLVQSFIHSFMISLSCYLNQTGFWTLQNKKAILGRLLLCLSRSPFCLGWLPLGLCWCSCPFELFLASGYLFNCSKIGCNVRSIFDALLIALLTITDTWTYSLESSSLFTCYFNTTGHNTVHVLLSTKLHCTELLTAGYSLTDCTNLSTGKVTAFYSICHHFSTALHWELSWLTHFCSFL